MLCHVHIFIYLFEYEICNWVVDSVLKRHYVQPENIILDESSGKVKLVDFGAVQDAAAVTLIGSTVVGTVCMFSMQNTFHSFITTFPWALVI